MIPVLSDREASEQGIFGNATVPVPMKGPRRGVMIDSGFDL